MDKLLDGLSAIGAPCPEESAAKLREYLSELILFNPALKLVGEKSEEGIIVRHLLDSASAYRFFDELTQSGDVIADLGSGAGLPGIVLSVLFPDREFVLIERMSRRAGFLRGVIAKLGLRNACVSEHDIKDIDRKFSVLTCRAFHPVNDIAKSASALLSDDGKALFYKGQRANAERELEALSASYSFDSRIEPLEVPYLDEERVLIVLSHWRMK